MKRDIIKPITRALPWATMPSKLSAAAMGLGLLRRKRRRSPALSVGVGLAVAAAAAAALLVPSSRKSLGSLLTRTGGGVGKRLGRFLGEHAGAHPMKTASVVQSARELVSRDHVS